ncbi:coiled-coil domain-containing protein-domain-containing protein [Biscogniauxia sp. FL1348]|nr:coiled-coil domain-containing protein-domain-containing protein [Biscogniauxia sp. FL1348]
MPQILDMAPEPSPTRSYTKPQPRPPKSPAHTAQIRVQNRRREYLERHPSYFDSLEHELADPLLYDALIRRFQTHAEREQEGRTKGYSRVLEVDLLRGEARLSHLAQSGASASASASAAAVTDQDAYIREYADFATPAPRLSNLIDDSNGSHDRNTNNNNNNRSSSSSSRRNSNSSRGGDGRENTRTGEAEWGAPRAPSTQDEGRERWRDYLRRRFVLGRDEDFDYRTVDDDEDFDALERREREDAWFEDEDPEWASDEEDEEGEGVERGREEMRRRNEKIERPLQGETGIQDF